MHFLALSHNGQVITHNCNDNISSELMNEKSIHNSRPTSLLFLKAHGHSLHGKGRPHTFEIAGFDTEIDGPK